MANFDVSNAKFNREIRKMEVTDPCHADTFNNVFKTLINNDVALTSQYEELAKKVTNDNAQNKQELDKKIDNFIHSNENFGAYKVIADITTPEDTNEINLQNLELDSFKILKVIFMNIESTGELKLNMRFNDDNSINYSGVGQTIDPNNTPSKDAFSNSDNIRLLSTNLQNSLYSNFIELSISNHKKFAKIIDAKIYSSLQNIVIPTNNDFLRRTQITYTWFNSNLINKISLYNPEPFRGYKIKSGLKILVLGVR